MQEWKNTVAYSLGAFGHDLSYGALNTYLLMSITSIMFSGGDKNCTIHTVAITTMIIMVVRIIESVLDPFIGSVIDKTNSKWGKYRPWILGTGLILGLGSPFLFTTMSGLAAKNGHLFLILFTIMFFALYIVYTFKDISFWGLLPAMSLSSDDRGFTVTGARVGSTIGGNIITVLYVVLLIYFSGSSNLNEHGWFMFALTIGLTQFVGAAFTAFGTKEKASVVTDQDQKETTIGQVLKTIGTNDQLGWILLSCIIYGLGTSIINGFMLHYFHYALDVQDKWQYIGWLGTFSGFASTISYPFLAKYFSRQKIMIGSMPTMVLAYIIYSFTQNVVMALIAQLFYTLAGPLVFMVLLLTTADCVEYGQLKTGHRSEAATSAVHPMFGKFNGVVTTSLTDVIAGIVGMTGNVTASSITAHDIFLSKTFAFYTPLATTIMGMIIFMVEIKLDEKIHNEIANKLTKDIKAEKNE